MNTLNGMKRELKQLTSKLEKYNDILNSEEMTTMDRINIEDQMRFMFQYKWQLEHRIRTKGDK
ncbi:MAG: hypothetical protein ACRC23_01890 [Aeromonas jandaei]